MNLFYGSPRMKNRRPKVYNNFIKENEIAETPIGNGMVAEGILGENMASAGVVLISSKNVPPENGVKQNANNLQEELTKGKPEENAPKEIKKNFIEVKQENINCVENNDKIKGCNMKDRSCADQGKIEDNKHINDISLSPKVKEVKSDEVGKHFSDSCKAKEMKLDRTESPPEIDSKILKDINAILKVLNEFSRQLKAKDSFSEIERLVIEGEECKSLHLSHFSRFIRSYEISDDFIYYNNIKDRSGSLLFYSIDFKYAIKTVSQKELTLSAGTLKHFSEYFEENPNSYISRLAGIYLTPNKGFIVMENILSSKFNKIGGFDEKNTSMPALDSSRETKKQNIVELKNRDRLSLKNRDFIMSAIKKDTDFLRSLNLIDYLFVVGCSSSEIESYGAFNSKGQQLKWSVDGISGAGIANVFTEYDLSKKLERIWNLLCCNSEGSCVNPEMYQIRFMDVVYNEHFGNENNNESNSTDPVD